MVYESDFYTTRRPYSRPSALSSYSSTSPILIQYPAYGRIQTYTTYSVPRVYIPHHLNVAPQRLSVLPQLAHLPNRRLVVSRVAPHHLLALRVRPSVVNRELLRIEHKARSHVGYSATEDYLNSSSAMNFDDETRAIRAQTASLLRRVHTPVPRAYHQYLPVSSRYEQMFPTSLATDPYISRLFGQTSKVAQDIINMSHYREPARRYTGNGHLACLRYSGNKAFSKRRSFYEPDGKIRNDVNLLSYYLKNRNAAKGNLAELDSTVNLPPNRPSRRFTAPKNMEDPGAELKEYKASRLESLIKPAPPSAAEIDAEAVARRKKQKQEEAKLAEDRAVAEELSRKKEQAKRDEANRAAELARQEELAAQAAAERAAEIERKAEEAAKKQAEEDAAAEAAKKKQAADQAAKKEEEARIAEEHRIREEEEKKQLARLQEIEKQAQEEKEEELARQAAELAELARQESELAELARQEAELAELARQEAELAELAKQEAELAELAKQEAELAELAAQEAELAAAEAPADAAEDDYVSEEEAPIASPVPTVEEPETPEPAPEAAPELSVHEDASQNVEASENEQTEGEEEEE